MGSQRSLIHSFRYALRGLYRAASTEPNFQLHLLATATVAALIIILPVTVTETLILLIATMAVLILELMNIAVERLVDIIKPRIHHYAGVIKDVTAAAVLVASVGAFVIGLIIFLPYILRVFASAEAIL